MITIDSFRSYLSERLSENSVNSYLSYLRQCDSSTLTSLSTGQSLFTTLCDNCNSTELQSDRYDIVQNYITECTLKLSELDSCEAKKRKTLNNIRSALRMFLNYVTSDNYTCSSKQIHQSFTTQKRRMLNIENQIDGMSILIDRFSGIKQFIEFVLSGCYFFSQDDAIEQHNKILYQVIQRLALPARHSTDIKLYNNRKDIKRGTKNVIYNDGKSGDILIDIDGNGNAAIDKLFTIKTHRYLKGNKSRKPDFVNLKISHIWGRAFDPRFFTNLWNIVLVPSFANDILDKPASCDGSYYIGAVLLNTLKCILHKYYRLNLLNWTDLGLTTPSYLSDKVIRGTYQINVFDTIMKDETPDIKQVEVTI